MSFAFSVSGPFLPLFIIQLGVKPIAAVSAWAGIIASVNFLAAAIFSPDLGRRRGSHGPKSDGRSFVRRRSDFHGADGRRAERLAALCGARLHGDLQRLLRGRDRDGRHASSRGEPRLFARLDDDGPARRRHSAGRSSVDFSPIGSSRITAKFSIVTSLFALAAALVCIVFVQERFQPEKTRADALRSSLACTRSRRIRGSRRCSSSCCSRKSSLLACSRSLPLFVR